jgi:response regulator of citrate/malate metabolism
MTAHHLPDVDAVTINAAQAVITEHGLAGLTVERLAETAGTSRMTLHRRQITRPR